MFTCKTKLYENQHIIKNKHITFQITRLIFIIIFFSATPKSRMKENNLSNSYSYSSSSPYIFVS